MTQSCLSLSCAQYCIPPIFLALRRFLSALWMSSPFDVETTPFSSLGGIIFISLSLACSLSHLDQSQTTSTCHHVQQPFALYWFASTVTAAASDSSARCNRSSNVSPHFTFQIKLSHPPALSQLPPHTHSLWPRLCTASFHSA